ncbi:GAP family protein [Zhihengliuella flava]|uniref:GAP family protein n=1 Tax=Zhihengliuella flava TaxID=1285193 RepID=A0A931GG84_9MICC|nr:GAP family protein [Zhihengliuella flava]MBG6085517.1 hypothetical protein [Zhihengliuella flava]
MSELLGDLLPTAIGLAISPIPIVAIVLLLLMPRARVKSVLFLIGWLAGIIVLAGLFAVAGGSLPEPDPEASKPLLGSLQLLLGGAALFFAITQWRARPRGDAQPAAPQWMASMEGLSPAAIFGLGALLASVNPKNLILNANAGLSIGSGAASWGQALALLAFVAVIGGISVWVPVLANLIWEERLRQPLARLRDELQRYNAIIMAVLLLMIGAQMIGKALHHF